MTGSRVIAGRNWADDRGLTTVEYIIVLCLIAVVGLAIWRRFGETVKNDVAGAESVVGGLPTTSEE